MARKKTTIAVVFPASIPWMAETLRGIKSYADRHGGWAIITSPPSLQSSGEETIHIPALRKWKGDGVITVLMSRREEELAGKLSIPVVNLSGWYPPTPKSLPRVNADYRAMGRLAADHFIATGIKHLAYYGFKQVWFSQERSAGLQQRATEMKCSFSEFLHPMSHRVVSWQQQKRLLLTWLTRLPKPVGVLCVHDYRARVILECCEELDLNVPDDVSVLGIDNDQITCDYCTPSLSSISRDPFACGSAAAELLHHLILKRSPKTKLILVPPGGIIQRQSTSRLYDDDPIIKQVIAYVQKNIACPFSVLSIAQNMNLSRRTLETRFQTQLGITPHNYILTQRINHAKTLLLQTETYRTLSEIAYACGFSSFKTFRMAFKALTKITPAHYREQNT
jgi:LacI family transcriptional regulator